jgi:heat shock protein HtpX
MLVQMAISRSREYDADATGARYCRNPHSLAGALRKLETANQRLPLQKVNEATAHMFIVNPLSGHKLAKLFSTHPPMDERIRRLEGMRI